MVPEMRGFTIEQLDFLFDSGVPTRRFAGYQFDLTEGELVGESTQAIEESMNKDDVKATVKAVRKAL
jgi:hypothetical protein